MVSKLKMHFTQDDSIKYITWDLKSRKLFVYFSYYSCDIASSESIQQCFKMVKEYGVNKLDILVNNAGVSNRNHPDDVATDVDRYL